MSFNYDVDPRFHANATLLVFEYPEHSSGSLGVGTTTKGQRSGIRHKSRYRFVIAETRCVAVAFASKPRTYALEYLHDKG